MILIGQDVLRSAGQKNAPRRNWLTPWAATVESLDWRSLEDVRKTYPSVDGVKLKSGSVVTVFNVKGNNFRLLTSIDYDSGMVEALEVLTHPEYDKNMWKVRY
jgi:mRNA interferase HigB